MIFYVVKLSVVWNSRRTRMKISEELEIAQSVMSRLWEVFQDDGNISRCYSTDRPRVATPNKDRYLAIIAKKKADRAQHQTFYRRLSSSTGTTVSRKTLHLLF